MRRRSRTRCRSSATGRRCCRWYPSCWTTPCGMRMSMDRSRFPCAAGAGKAELIVSNTCRQAEEIDTARLFDRFYRRMSPTPAVSRARASGCRSPVRPQRRTAARFPPEGMGKTWSFGSSCRRRTETLPALSAQKSRFLHKTYVKIRYHRISAYAMSAYGGHPRGSYDTGRRNHEALGCGGRPQTAQNTAPHISEKPVQRGRRAQRRGKRCRTDGPEEYDGIVLDIMMPGMDGLRVLQCLRREGIETPALFLTARAEVSQRVEGLKLRRGRLSHTTELLARVRGHAAAKGGLSARPAHARTGDAQPLHLSADLSG